MKQKLKQCERQVRKKRKKKDNEKAAAKRAWKLWDGTRLTGVAPGPVLFYNDPSLAGVVIKWYVGVEVHKRVLVVAIYGRAGEIRVLGPILRDTTDPASQAILWDSVAPFAPERFLMETTGVFHAPVAWELRTRFPGAQVVVMNAYALSAYVKRTRKGDRVDATRLAQFASVAELLRPSYVPDPAAWVLRDLARYRGSQRGEVTRQKNRLKKMMAVFGWDWDVNLRAVGQVRFLGEFLSQERSLGEFLTIRGNLLSPQVRKVVALWGHVRLPPDVREELLRLLLDLQVYQEIENLAESRLTTRVREFPPVQAAVDLFANFPGIGYLEALEFIAEVGDAARFEDAGRFLVYAGVAPAGGTSGVAELGAEEEKVVETDKPNPRSNRRLRGMLTRIAVAILRDCNRTTRQDDMYAYARSLKEQKMPKLRRVYKVAAKAGRILFHLLHKGEIYDAVIGESGKVNKASQALSRQARRRQMYRKERDARLAAERTTEKLLALLKERGIETDAITALALPCGRGGIPAAVTGVIPDGDCVKEGDEL